MKIKVLHIGIDYGMIQVSKGRRAQEYEVPKQLAIDLQTFLKGGK